MKLSGSKLYLILELRNILKMMVLMPGDIMSGRKHHGLDV